VLDAKPQGRPGELLPVRAKALSLGVDRVLARLVTSSVTQGDEIERFVNPNF
jgi:hypothetical protein